MVLIIQDLLTDTSAVNLLKSFFAVAVVGAVRVDAHGGARRSEALINICH